MRVDIPVRQVLPDLAILGISQRAPGSLRELSQSRGVDDRHAKGAIAEEILEAVSEGKAAPPPPVPPTADDLDRTLRPAVALISAWISQLARDEHVDTALLATRADLVAFLRGDDDARLGSGWRAGAAGRRHPPAGRRRGRADVRRSRPPPPHPRRVRKTSWNRREIRREISARTRLPLHPSFASENLRTGPRKSRRKRVLGGRRVRGIRVIPGWTGTIPRQCQISSVGALS